MREPDKILSNKESALENNFSFISFLSESIWYVEVCETLYLEVPASQLTGYSNYYCTQKQVRGQTAHYQDKWLMKGRVIVLISCKPFADARMSLFCFQVIRFRDYSRTSLCNCAL